MKKFTLRKLRIPKVTETQVVNAIFSVAPWMTPLTTSWIVLDACQSQLGWSFQQSLLAATIIELNGMSSTNLLLFLYKAKAARNMLWAGIIVQVVYLFAVVFLTLVLDTFPYLAKAAPMLFVALVMSSNATVAIRSYFKGAKTQKPQPGATKGATKLQPVADQGVNKVQPVDNNVNTAATKVQSVAQPVDISATTVATNPQPVDNSLQPVIDQVADQSVNKAQPVDSPASKVADKKSKLRVLLHDVNNRELPATQLAQLVGCSRQYLTKIAIKNGHGWEVVE